jgi:dTDP-glucose 4,6-dehydratase
MSTAAVDCFTDFAAQHLNALASSSPHLRSLRSRRLFITGATGFLGVWLLSLLQVLDRHGIGVEVTALSRDPGRFLMRHPEFRTAPWLRLIAGDVSNYSFPEGKFDYFVHAAADTSTDATENPLLTFRTAVEGTDRVLSHAVESGATKILLVSSGAVYGSQPTDVLRLTEDAPSRIDLGDPVTAAYGEGKRVMELLGATYGRQHSIDHVVARCFAFVGPGLSLDGHYAIGNFIRDALYASEIRVAGDGTPQRSYLYAADLAVWLLTLLVNGTPGHTYNVGSDREISIAELAYLVRDVLAPKKAVVIAQHAKADGPRRRYVPDISRARRELGLDSWTSLPSGIEMTGLWLRTAARTGPTDHVFTRS